MSLTDKTYIRDYHNFSELEPSDSFLDIMINRAKKKLISWVGIDSYTDAESETPTDLDRAEDLKDAEAELVMYYGVAKLNLKISNLGIVQSSKSTDIGEGNFTIATPEQIRKLRTDYLQTAKGIASKYIPVGSGVVAVKA